MAHIEIVVTGPKVETHIRGRVFRYAPKRKKQDMQPASRERRRVCVLDRHTGRLLEHWQHAQPCFGPRCTHRHYTRDEVAKLVRDGILRYVPGSNRNVAAFSFGRTWKGVPSGSKMGPKVMQLV